MLQAENTLYWFTPFFKRNDFIPFVNYSRQKNCKAFFCYDVIRNQVCMDELQFLKNELAKHGVMLIMIEGRIEKTVPSVARVLKAGKVVYSRPENYHEVEAVMKKIGKELELHSITFCDHPSHPYSFYNGGQQPGIRPAV
ncbi:MAG: deoxyribodipyrimidine photo-lyase [Bacteroidia bacterium]|nr:deoxyribodipyrimidine photo-lyase [Bacteroidia bacterium]